MSWEKQKDEEMMPPEYLVSAEHLSGEKWKIMGFCKGAISLPLAGNIFETFTFLFFPFIFKMLLNWITFIKRVNVSIVSFFIALLQYYAYIVCNERIVIYDYLSIKKKFWAGHLLRLMDNNGLPE